MKTRGFENIWDAIEGTPEAAMNMTLRSQLLSELRDLIEARELSQPQASKLFGVGQTRIADLLRGKIDLFSIDTLINMLVASGYQVEIRTRPAR